MEQLLWIQTDRTFYNPTNRVGPVSIFELEI